MNHDKSIAFFDFDGTITSKDTLAQLLLFIKGSSAYYAGLAVLSPVLTAYKLGIMGNQKAKEIMLAYFLKGMAEAAFDEKCLAFSTQVLPGIVRRDALTEINDHMASGREVVVVSASPHNWVDPWCKQIGISCISTRLEVVDGQLTGKITGRNCHGEEKVRRIRERYDLNNYKYVYAYGDTKGDLPMLSLASKKFYKPFRKI